MTNVSRRIADLQASLATLLDFLNNSEHSKRIGDPAICDFVFGNPHEMPLQGLVDAIRHHAIPESKDWFAYTFDEPKATNAISASLRARLDLPFEPEDVFATPGTFGALAVSLRALVDPGDEVVFLSPPWFFYEPMISVLGGTPVRVRLREPEFDLNVEDVEAAITARTRAIIVNSPHNPTGRIFSEERLRALGDVLARASSRNGRKVFLLSDESYNRIVFDGRAFFSPALAYPNTLVLYTYGKQLLAPGERIGYIALSPAIEDRADLRQATFFSQVVGGWQIPNATLQRAVPDLETLSIDVEGLQKRRDRLGDALVAMGYEVMIPESTFYMMVRSPIPDDQAFTRVLTEHDVFVGPGVIFEMPGYFRISLTANDEMVTRSLPGFEAAIKDVRGA